MRSPLLASRLAAAATLVLAALLTGCPPSKKTNASGGALTCDSRSTVSACTNGATPEIALGVLTPVACRDQCETALENAKVPGGCWVHTSIGCFCRSGEVTSGGTRPGGRCGVTSLACDTRSNLSACTSGATPEVDLGVIGSTQCRDGCEVALPAHGVNGSGCWVVALNGHCYCRSGGITTGGSSVGGACAEPVPLSCSSVTNVSACTDGPTPAIDLGALAATSCRAECQQWMAEARMGSGCWVVALDGHCYCRSGSLSTGGASSGGSCY
jgi:hypothetical protein